MTRFLTLIFCLVMILCPGPTAAETEWSGVVTRVIDGDTLLVVPICPPVETCPAQRVRLWGVDAMERDTAIGASAAEFVRRIVGGSRVTVLARGIGPYRRTIARVILPDGRDLGRVLIATGWAVWSRRYAPKADDYRQAEAEARKARLGIWK